MGETSSKEVELLLGEVGERLRQGGGFPTPYLSVLENKHSSI